MTTKSQVHVAGFQEAEVHTNPRIYRSSDPSCKNPVCVCLDVGNLYLSLHMNGLEDVEALGWDIAKAAVDEMRKNDLASLDAIPQL